MMGNMNKLEGNSLVFASFESQLVDVSFNSWWTDTWHPYLLQGFIKEMEAKRRRCWPCHKKRGKDES